ncbi:FAD binding domain-containing protein [Novispirillum sp. DQ9]|uniref:FAD binding domain-containing protein n=1 Tax=Novispirillum sp. DQ9 TaxID=3398612 RepID=UPI003C7AA4ED
MFPFDYHRATTLQDAREAHEAADEPVYLAGGQTLIPTLKMRLAQHDRVIDLRRIPGMAGIRREGDVLVIGALATHAAIAESDVVRAALPALAEMAASIGDQQVRAMGTIGGAIANNDPAADYPAAALALGATIVTDRRSHAMAAFLGEFFDTALEPGEIIREIRLPVAAAAGYAKVRNPASRYAVVGVFVARMADGPRVAITGAAGKAFRHAAMEQALAGDFSPGALDGVTTCADGLNDDQHASADYRAHLCGVLARRAVERALGADRR